MTSEEKRGLLKPGSGSMFLMVFSISFLLAKVFSLVFNKIFIVIFEPSEMGLFSIIVIAIATLNIYSALGFSAALNRYTIAYQRKKKIEQLKDFVTTGFTIYVVVEFLIIIVLMILYFSLGFKPDFLDVDPYIYTLLLVGILALSQRLSSTCMNIATSLQKSKHYSIIVISRVALQIPFGLLFVLVFKMGILGLIIGFCTAEFLVAIYGGYYLFRDLGIGKFSLKEGKIMLSYSVPGYLAGILLSTFSIGILAYIDYVLPDTGRELIAFYQLGAVALVNLLLIADKVFRQVYRPIIFKYFEQKRYDDIRKTTIIISKIFVMVVLLGGILLYAFSPLLIPLISEPEYLASISVIPIVFLGSMFSYLTAMVCLGHVLYFKNYWRLVGAIVSVIAAVIVGIFVIPINGLFGLALAYLVLRFLNFIFLFIVSQNYFKIKYDFIILLKIVLATVISLGIGCLFYFFVFTDMDFNLVVSFFISSLAYVGLILSLKLVTKNDISFFKGFFDYYLNLAKKKLKING